jgi:flagellar assembly protein FliH
MALTRARVISDRLPGTAYERWELPSVEAPEAIVVAEPEVPEEPPLQWPTADEIAAIHQQAYEEGLAYGRKEGYEQAYVETRTEWDAKCQELQSLMTFLARPLETIDQEVEQNLVELIVLIAKQLIRRELKTSPGEIVAVVREAMGQLPLAARHPRLHLHPEDIELVKTALGVENGQSDWVLLGDPLMTRGGCMVETDVSRIDATVEARLTAVVAQFFGGERAGDKDA